MESSSTRKEKIIYQIQKIIGMIFESYTKYNMRAQIARRLFRDSGIMPIQIFQMQGEINVGIWLLLNLQMEI